MITTVAVNTPKKNKTQVDLVWNIIQTIYEPQCAVGQKASSTVQNSVKEHKNFVVEEQTS